MKLTELSASDLGALCWGLESIRDRFLERDNRQAIGAAMWCDSVLADIGTEAARRDEEARNAEG